MEFLKYLKEPFKYSKDIEKINIINSLKILGISNGVLAIVLLILSKTIVSIVLNSIGLGMFDSYGGKYIATFTLGIVISNILATIVLVTIIFVIKKICNKEAKFEESLAMVSVLLLWPTIILILLILTLAFDIYAIYFVVIILFISIIMLTVNVYEGLKLIGLSSAKSAYISAAVVGAFYFVNYFIASFVISNILFI